jgi:hypothetical protein
MSQPGRYAIPPSIKFLASIPPIQSAIKIAGDAGMRITIDVPESELMNAIGLLALRDSLLHVEIKVENDKDEVRNRFLGS